MAEMFAPDNVAAVSVVTTAFDQGPEACEKELSTLAAKLEKNGKIISKNSATCSIRSSNTAGPIQYIGTIEYLKY